MSISHNYHIKSCLYSYLVYLSSTLGSLRAGLGFLVLQWFSYFFIFTLNTLSVVCLTAWFFTGSALVFHKSIFLTKSVYLSIAFSYS